MPPSGCTVTVSAGGSDTGTTDVSINGCLDSDHPPPWWAISGFMTAWRTKLKFSGVKTLCAVSLRPFLYGICCCTTASGELGRGRAGPRLGLLLFFLVRRFDPGVHCFTPSTIGTIRKPLKNRKYKSIQGLGLAGLYFIFYSLLNAQ